jgi:hypothetical protein
VADAAAKVESIKSSDDSKDTWNRTVEHLKANNVNLDAIKIGMGQHLKLDPKTETFPDSDTEKANAMLTREYRAPFIVPAAGQV